MQGFAQVLTSFSVYHTFHNLNELGRLCSDEVFHGLFNCVGPFFSLSFCISSLLFEFYIFLSTILYVQCQWAMSMSPVPVSSSGRRGRPSCKAMSLIPPTWADGHSTSTIYSTHAVVRIQKPRYQEKSVRKHCSSAYSSFCLIFS